ncbi:hypothetical protein PIB30_046165 [Stylosanthes scabra]|uniref:Uncharacterized protein n=1 Tax=Stylosanthes scabra TaxID=79078 RepID=A0ABU6VER7_9FABA|nr:hypothetical protein [Stylosanthes scabra]
MENPANQANDPANGSKPSDDIQNGGADANQNGKNDATNSHHDSQVTVNHNQDSDSDVEISHNGSRFAELHEEVSDTLNDTTTHDKVDLTKTNVVGPSSSQAQSKKPNHVDTPKKVLKQGAGKNPQSGNVNSSNKFGPSPKDKGQKTIVKSTNKSLVRPPV